MTIDSYIEETQNDAGLYETTNTIYFNTDGYRSAKYLHKTMNVDEYVEVRCGRSPDDVKSLVHEVHDTAPLDYVFIDGGHFSNQILMDVRAIAPLLAPKFLVIFHDVYDTFDPIREEIECLLGGELRVVLPFPHGENMGIITTLNVQS